MADITDPEVIRFCNEVLRPLSEKLRDIDLLIDATTEAWDETIKPKLAANAAEDVVADGREGEGVSRITKGHLNQFAGVLALLTTALSADVQSRKKVKRLCVRYFNTMR